MIKVEDVTIKIKDTTILQGVNATFEDGKIHGIVGGNGSGKTMLLKCICGFVSATEGRVIVNEKVIGKDVDYIRDAGIIIETPGFISYYSGYKNLCYLASLRKRISEEEIRECMLQCGLDPALKRPVKKYSMGMRQRLGIAQAIMEKPDVLILDEPFNGLDREGVREIRQVLLQRKKEGVLILLVSHNASDIDYLCDKTYEMDAGKLKFVSER